MTIKFKLLLALCCLTFFSIMIIGWQGYSRGKASLSEASFNQLTAVRGSKARQIESYFSQIRSQILTFSENRMVVEAMRGFKPAFHNIISDRGVTPEQLTEYAESVRGYYDAEFLPRLYANLDPSEHRSIEHYWSDEDAVIYQQYQYISNNPNEVGSKETLDFADDGSAYAGLHAKYHPVVRSYLNEFGYYDIFLLDNETGHIVYSVFKEADYGTSLLTGPYKDTNFADAFRAAAAATDPNFVKLFDFKRYHPSYSAAASFISSPVFDGDEKIGVAIFQMPVDVINSIMTGNESWKADGLGDSGETYLVGEDFKMRSISRFLIEDPDGYFGALESVNTDPKTINSIRSIGTSLGLQTVRTNASIAALSGDTNTDIVDDYRGVPVLSSYTPLKIDDVNWAILSEIDEAEAFAPVEALSQSIFGWGIGIIVFSIVIALLFTGTITRPIMAVVSRLRDISEGDGDLTQRLEARGQDEIAQVGNAFNAFVGKIQKIMQDVSENTQSLTVSSQNLSKTSTDMNAGAEQMSVTFNSVTTATEEMRSTINEVSKNTAEVSKIANEVDKDSQNASEKIQMLETSAREIGKVVDTIQDIAEQTNLLALNATIEAASAGDAGKGFAVVANEVKELAYQTANSTKEIAQKIEEIQTNTQNAVVAVGNISEITSRLNDIAKVTAASVEEQSATTNEVAGSVNRAADLASKTSEGASEANQNSSELADMAARLKNLIGQFKI